MSASKHITCSLAHLLPRSLDKIGPDIERVQSFVYNMGAERLDGYLFFKVEEAVRSLVQTVTHDKVIELRSEFAEQTKEQLNRVMTPMGVTITSVIITDVALPRDLQKRLESTTAFRTRIAEQQKEAAFKEQQMENEQEQQQAAWKQFETIETQKVVAESTRYEIDMDSKMAMAESKRKQESGKANGEYEVAVTKARGKIEVATFEGRSNTEAMISTGTIKPSNCTHALLPQQ